jgi:hypothetical protein
VEVEDHVLFFHFLEDGVEGLVVEDTGGRVLWRWVRSMHACVVSSVVRLISTLVVNR